MRSPILVSRLPAREQMFLPPRSQQIATTFSRTGDKRRLSTLRT